MKTDFEHRQGAHCESGVTSNLLSIASNGKITEPLAFGIGAGLFFAYIPLIKINNGPAIAFRSKQKAQTYLDERLAEGIPVGCQVGVYYLPYFPKEYRFHFNAHNLIVYDKQGDNYLISDPIMETTHTMSSYELERVRFAKGALAPKGHIYYAQKGAVITDDTIKEAIKSGIKKNIYNMLNIPGSFAGISGIRNTGKKIKNWRDKLGIEKSKLYLAQMVRMQEEIGTGGGGFRYIYAAFLQEADTYLPGNQLAEISVLFTQAGDMWRTAAIQAAGIFKGRIGSQDDFNKMGDYLLEIADLEEDAFKKLKNIKWQ